MFRSLFRKGEQELPSYSLLRDAPSRPLPQELAIREQSEEYKQWADRIQSDLFAQPADENAPGFATFLKCGDGLLQFLAPGIPAGCLLVFSTAMRACDYAQVQPIDKGYQYFCTSATQFVGVVSEFREQGATSDVGLDRCPRCGIFVSVKATSFQSAAQAIRWWKIVKSTEIARTNLYLEYACTVAGGGQVLTARDVALELVGHVTLEDPRAHLLLGKLAIKDGDKQLLREAKAFLSFLKQDSAMEQLRSAERSKIIEF